MNNKQKRYVKTNAARRTGSGTAPTPQSRANRTKAPRPIFKTGPDTEDIVIVKGFCVMPRQTIEAALNPVGINIHRYKEGYIMSNGTLDVTGSWIDSNTVLGKGGTHVSFKVWRMLIATQASHFLSGLLSAMSTPAYPVACFAVISVTPQARQWAETMLRTQNKVTIVNQSLSPRAASWAKRRKGLMPVPWVEATCKDCKNPLGPATRKGQKRTPHPPRRK